MVVPLSVFTRGNLVPLSADVLSWDGADLVAQFENHVSVEIVEVVVDLDEAGLPIGIEILGLLAKHPGLPFAQSEILQSSLSVDEDADALYLRLSEGRSIDQAVHLAAIAFASSDRILALRLRMEP